MAVKINNLNVICFITRSANVGDCDLFNILPKVLSVLSYLLGLLFVILAAHNTMYQT